MCEYLDKQEGNEYVNMCGCEYLSNEGRIIAMCQQLNIYATDKHLSDEKERGVFAFSFPSFSKYSRENYSTSAF